MRLRRSLSLRRRRRRESSQANCEHISKSWIFRILVLTIRFKDTVRPAIMTDDIHRCHRKTSTVNLSFITMSKQFEKIIIIMNYHATDFAVHCDVVQIVLCRHNISWILLFITNFYWQAKTRFNSKNCNTSAVSCIAYNSFCNWIYINSSTTKVFFIKSL